MKVAALFLALTSSAAAFAPAQQVRNLICVYATYSAVNHFEKVTASLRHILF